MTSAALYNYSRLTDSMERDMLRNALENQDSLSPLAALKIAAKSVVAAARGFADFCSDVSNAMDEARARSAHYSGSQW